MLKMRICVYTTRRLQWIVIDCKRKLQQDKGYCTKNIVGAHLTSPPHIKIGCTPVRLTWEDHLLSLFHSEEFDEQAAITGLTVLTWLLLNPRAQRYFLTFKFGVTRAVRCTWTKWPRAYHEFSTFVRWLSFVDIAWFVGLVNNCCSGVPEENRSPIPHRSHRAYLFNMFTWHSYGIGIYPTPQVSPCLSNHTVAWHSWRCHGWWGRRAWGRRRR